MADHFDAMDSDLEGLSDSDLAKALKDDTGSKRVRILMRRAEPLIEQLDATYRQYVLGVEDIPPNERRLYLDQMITSILYAPKTTTEVKYRFEVLYNRYITFRDRWDRMIKDLEAGKIQRITGGKKNKNFRSER
jgi:hypothetical protein